MKGGKKKEKKKRKDGRHHNSDVNHIGLVSGSPGRVRQTDSQIGKSR
jgi:hypothetical protein